MTQITLLMIAPLRRSFSDAWMIDDPEETTSSMIMIFLPLTEPPSAKLQVPYCFGVFLINRVG